MKKFVAGVLATVFAGLLLLVSQDWVRESFLDERGRIEYFEFQPRFITSASEVAEWQKQLTPLEDSVLQGADRIAVTAISIENRGESPIREQDVLISSKYDDFDQGVLGFKNDVVPGKFGVDTLMSVEEGQLKIKYELLDEGEMHRFWIIHDRYSALQFGIRNPDIEVKGWDSKIYTKPEESFWNLDTVFFLFVAFLLGGLIASFLEYIQASKAFERQGMNYLEFLKRNKELKRAEKSRESDA